MNGTKLCKMDKKSGFTLVEVVVAILVLGLCMGGLCQLAVNTRQLSDMARGHYVAINIAKNRLERAKTVDYEDLSFLIEPGIEVNASGRPISSGMGHFRVNTQVSQAATNLMEITVNVEIRNPITMEFDGESEMIQTYVADIAGVE